MLYFTPNHLTHHTPNHTTCNIECFKQTKCFNHTCMFDNKLVEQYVIFVFCFLINTWTFPSPKACMR